MAESWTPAEERAALPGGLTGRQVAEAYREWQRFPGLATPDRLALALAAALSAAAEGPEPDRYGDGYGE